MSVFAGDEVAASCDLRHQRARDQHEGGDVEHDRGHGQRQAVFPVGCPHGVVSRRRPLVCAGT
jgi:hypothetical protein